MEASLLQYGALGILVLACFSAVGVLWKQNLVLSSQLLDVLGRYEGLVKDLVEKETSLEGTLENLQEGLAARELLAQFIVSQKDR